MCELRDKLDSDSDYQSSLIGLSMRSTYIFYV